MTVASLLVKIGADIKELETALSKASRSVEDVGKKMTAVGKTLSKTVTAPLLGFGALALRTAGNFEESMNRVAAISQATGDELQNLEDVARRLGATTQFSASQAADAMSFLAMAGFEVNEIASAMPSVLNLAAAAQLDMASSADIASNIMSGFNMTAEELEGAVDVLAKSFTSANTDLSQLGEAMKMVGPVASGFGVQFEETAAAVGFLSDAGIQASSAGTGLRRIMTTLAQNAEKLGINVFDASGNMRPLADMIEDIEKTGLSSAKAMEIFGDRGGPAMQVLLSRGSAALREMTSELGNAGGTAQRIADQQMQGLNGALKELRSAFEELQIVIAKSGILDFATGLVQKITTLIQRFAALNPEALRFGTIVAGVAAAIGPLLIVGGKLTAWTGRALGMFTKLIRVFGLLVSPIFLKIAALAALVLIGKSIWDTFEPLQNFFIKLWDGISSAFESAINFIIKGWNKVRDVIARVVPGISAAVVTSVSWMNEQTEGKLGEFAGNVQKNFEEAVAYVQEFASGAIEAVTGYIGALGQVEEATEKVTESTEELAGAVSNVARPINEVVDTTAAVGRSISLVSEHTEGSINRMREQADHLRVMMNAATNPEQIKRYAQELKALENKIQSLTDTSTELSQGQSLLISIGNDFTSSFGQGLTNVLVASEKLSDSLKNIGKLLASTVIQRGLSALLTGGLGGSGFFGSGGGLFGRIFGVNDALITSSGDVVKFHPDDNILAMKDFSSLGGGAQRVIVEGSIRGDTIHIANARGGGRFR